MGEPITWSRVQRRLCDGGRPDANELADEWFAALPGDPPRIWAWLDAGVLRPGDTEGKVLDGA